MANMTTPYFIGTYIDPTLSNPNTIFPTAAYSDARILVLLVAGCISVALMLLYCTGLMPSFAHRLDILTGSYTLEAVGPGVKTASYTSKYGGTLSAIAVVIAAGLVGDALIQYSTNFWIMRSYTVPQADGRPFTPSNGSVSFAVTAQRLPQYTGAGCVAYSSTSAGIAGLFVLSSNTHYAPNAADPNSLACVFVFSQTTPFSLLQSPFSASAAPPPTLTVSLGLGLQVTGVAVTVPDAKAHAYTAGALSWPVPMNASLDWGRVHSGRMAFTPATYIDNSYFDAPGGGAVTSGYRVSFGDFTTVPAGAPLPGYDPEGKDTLNLVMTLSGLTLTTELVPAQGISQLLGTLAGLMVGLVILMKIVYELVDALCRCVHLDTPATLYCVTCGRCGKPLPLHGYRGAPVGAFDALHARQQHQRLPVEAAAVSGVMPVSLGSESGGFTGGGAGRVGRPSSSRMSITDAARRAGSVLASFVSHHQGGTPLTGGGASAVSPLHHGGLTTHSEADGDAEEGGAVVVMMQNNNATPALPRGSIALSNEGAAAASTPAMQRMLTLARGHGKGSPFTAAPLTANGSGSAASIAAGGYPRVASSRTLLLQRSSAASSRKVQAAPLASGAGTAAAPAAAAVAAAVPLTAAQKQAQAIADNKRLQHMMRANLAAAPLVGAGGVVLLGGDGKPLRGRTAPAASGAAAAAAPTTGGSKLAAAANPAMLGAMLAIAAGPAADPAAASAGISSPSSRSGSGAPSPSTSVAGGTAVATATKKGDGASVFSFAVAGDGAAGSSSAAHASAPASASSPSPSSATSPRTAVPMTPRSAAASAVAAAASRAGPTPSTSPRSAAAAPELPAGAATAETASGLPAPALQPLVRGRTGGGGGVAGRYPGSASVSPQQQQQPGGAGGLAAMRARFEKK